MFFCIPFLILVEQSVVDEADHEVEKCENCEVLPHELVYASAPSNSNRASMQHTLVMFFWRAAVSGSDQL